MMREHAGGSTSSLMWLLMAVVINGCASSLWGTEASRSEAQQTPTPGGHSVTLQPRQEMKAFLRPPPGRCVVSV